MTGFIAGVLVTLLALFAKGASKKKEHKKFDETPEQVERRKKEDEFYEDLKKSFK